MTGYDVIKRAMHLLGYSGDAGDPSELGSTSVKGFEIIKQLLIDLKCSDISSLSEAFDISKTKEDALCYGAAMLLALTEGDADKNRIFTEIYNSKRAAALCSTECVKDCLPKVTEG